MAEIKKDRVEYVDIAKAFAIFLVVLGHPRPVEDYGSLEQFLYAFHMPLFFILSGVFVRQKRRYDAQSWKAFFKKNLLTLILPYVIWVAIYMPFTYVDLTKALYGSWLMLRDMQTLSSLWFLPVLFLARTYIEALMALSAKFRWSPHKAAAICAALFYIVGMVLPHNNTEDNIGMPWGFDIAFVAAAFMLMGYLFQPVFQRLAKLNNWLKLAVATGCLALLVVGIQFAEYSENHPFMLMANAEYGSPALCLTNGITGSVMVVMLAQLISSFFHSRNWIFFGWLIYIGQNTMGIYLIHKPFLQGLYERTLQLAPGMPYLLRAILLACAAVAFSLFLIYFLSRYSGEILGQASKTGGANQKSGQKPSSSDGGSELVERGDPGV